MTMLRCTRRTFAAGLALAAALAATPALAQSTLEDGQGQRLHPRRLRQRGAVRLRDPGRRADRRGAGGGQGGARQDGHHRGRRRADRVRLADPRPQGRPLRHHRRRHVREPRPLQRDRLLRALLRHRPGDAGARRQPQGHRRLRQHRRERRPEARGDGRRGRGRLRQRRRRRPRPDRQPARPGEPRRRRPGRPRRRRGADRALDRRHGLEGRGRRVRPSRSARSPASRSRATAPSASARRTPTCSRPSTPSSPPSSAPPSTSRWSSPSASAPTTCRTSPPPSSAPASEPRAGAAARRPAADRRSAMGLGTLAGMLLAALALIGLLATRPDYAVFLPQLLQGAVLTVEITLLGCLLAIAAGVLAALARLYGAGAGPLARHHLRRDLPRHLGARPALLAVLRAAAVRPDARRPSSSPSSRSASTSAPTAPRWCAAPSSACRAASGRRRPRST